MADFSIILSHQYYNNVQMLSGGESRNKTRISLLMLHLSASALNRCGRTQDPRRWHSCICQLLVSAFPFCQSGAAWCEAQKTSQSPVFHLDQGGHFGFSSRTSGWKWLLCGTEWGCGWSLGSGWHLDCWEAWRSRRTIWTLSAATCPPKPWRSGHRQTRWWRAAGSSLSGSSFQGSSGNAPPEHGRSYVWSPLKVEGNMTNIKHTP